MSVPRITELLEKTGGCYGIAIAKGLVKGAKPFVKVGFNSAVGTQEETVWSNGGIYAFPAAPARWRIAAGNAADVGTVIKGNAEGAAQTIKCDAGGSETVLIDANVDFTAATGVAVGDIVLLDPKGDEPEFGYITDITNAATGTLIIGGGFSEGGSCATARAYTIVDKSGSAGAQVIEVYYLNSSFEEKKILIALNGASAVDFANVLGAALADCYRLNEMRVIAAGSNGIPTAAIVLQLQAAPNTVYGYITAGFTLSRSSVYTVPKDMELFVSSLALSATTPNDVKVQAARIILRANVEDYSGFITDGISNVFGETMLSNETATFYYDPPMKFPTGADILISAIGETGFSGPVSSRMRGWIETVR